MKYNKQIALAFFAEHGLPHPELEFKFHPERKWRFDFAFRPESLISKVALEVEGAVWIAGRHTRGSGFVKDMEKYNAAAVLGWRILRVQPKDICTKETADMIRNALLFVNGPEHSRHD